MAYWDDEMEVGNTGYPWMVGGMDGWECGGVSTGMDTVNKISGNGSLRIGYPGNGITCGGFEDRYFPETLDLYSRFYIRLAPGFFLNATNSTKIMMHSTQNGISDWLAMTGGESNDSSLLISLQRWLPGNETMNAWANLGTNEQYLRTTPEGGWRLVETREKLNTVGQADAIVQAWVDGVKVLEYTGLEPRKINGADDYRNVSFIFNRMYRQYGEGNINYDRVAMGDARIGPITGGLPPPPPPPPSPPTQPTGLQVT